MDALIGTKQGQSQQFTPEGKRVAVTMITVGPSWITQVIDSPTRKSIQVGMGQSKHLTKAQAGHLKKAGLTEKLRFLHEFTVSAIAEGEKPGASVSVSDVFAAGDVIRVTGVSKGKGFASAIKRYNFKGGPRTHGQSDRERAPGSIGATTTPGRVYRGKRMAGRMGNDTTTVKGLKVVAVDQEKNMLTVSGVVPGARGGLVIIQKER